MKTKTLTPFEIVFLHLEKERWELFYIDVWNYVKYSEQFLKMQKFKAIKWALKNSYGKIRYEMKHLFAQLFVKAKSLWSMSYRKENVDKVSTTIYTLSASALSCFEFSPLHQFIVTHFPHFKVLCCEDLFDNKSNWLIS